LEIKIIDLYAHRDQRGHLIELFREDILASYGFKLPRMGYISWTHPGILRGPHEHMHQTDVFVFVEGQWKLTLLDNNRFSDGFGEVVSYEFGKSKPAIVVIPPRIIHGYRNIGKEMSFVLNFPDKLYAGWNKKYPVDEVRYEENKEILKYYATD